MPSRPIPPVLVLFLLAGPLLAQAPDEGRVERLERRLRALEETVSMRGAGGAVAVRVVGPAEGLPGQDLPFRVVVANGMAGDAIDIEVEVDVDPRLEVTDAGGADWDRDGRRLTWILPSLPAATEHVFTFGGRADETGDLSCCASVAYRTGSCSLTRILQPAIVCQVSAPEQVLLGQPFTIVASVTSTGTGTARGIVGRLEFDGGLVATEGASATCDFGDLAAGERREVRITVAAREAGDFGVRLVVEGQPALASRCEVSGRVLYPELEIEKTGPRFRYEGQPVEYRIVVTSTGTAAARNVRLVDPVPDGARLVEAGPDARIGQRAAFWNLGDLAPGERREVSVVLQALAPGRITNCAWVRADAMEDRSACAETEILVMAAMHIDCIDTEDPVEIGGETTYEITVRNEGHRDTTEVVLRVDLPAECEFLASKCDVAAGTYDAASHQVAYDAIPVMRPGEESVYRIRVRFREAGSAVCSARLDFAEFSKSIRSEEGTNVYE